MNKYFNNYVAHPIFGKEPIKSNYSFTDEQIKEGLYLDEFSYFKESAIPANIEQQKHGIFPRKFYVDIERSCTDCQRMFIWFAKEQKYWFEQQFIHTNAKCLRCYECRQEHKKQKKIIQNYSYYSTKDTLKEDDLEAFLLAAIELSAEGLLLEPKKVLEELNRFKENHKRLPEKLKALRSKLLKLIVESKD